ncbi:MAG: PAS domain-containing sensor histidine kinase [Bacteroidota bacterium]
MKGFFNQTSPTEIYHILNSIFENAIDGVIAIDRGGIVGAVNPAAAQLFGYEADEIIGENIKMLMPEPYHDEHDGYIKNYHHTGEKKIIGIGRQVKGRKKDGTIFPFRLSVSEVETEDRTFYTGFIHDVSDLQTAKEQLEQMNTQLEQLVEERTEELSKAINRLLQTNQQLIYEVAERKAAQAALKASEKKIQAAYEKEKELGELKTNFVSMASHEFRTPLTTISSSAGLLARYTLSEQQEKREKHIQRIKKSVQHLTGILNDFLSFNKLEEGKVEVNLSLFDWGNFCQEVVEEMNGMLKKEQKIETELIDNQNIKSDARLLKNVLYNLFSNAIKYSPERSTIKIKSTVQNDQLHFSVQDEGIGIPEAEQQYLFSRFFRANNATTIKGTGLGLTIVKQYLELLGGDINFESEEEKGSIFYVNLPIQ